MLKFTWPLYKSVIVMPVFVLTMYPQGLIELQLFALGSIVIKPPYVSILLLLALTLGWMFFYGLIGKVSLMVSPRLVKFYAIYASYLVFSWVLVFRFEFLPVDYIVTMLLDQVIWIFVLGMAFLQPSSRDQVTATRGAHAWVFVLSIVTLLLMVLGVLQYWSQSLIVVPIDSTGSGVDTTQLVDAPDFFGQVRAVSAFGSANAFGQYLLFFTVFWLAMMLQKGRRPVAKVLLGSLVIFSGVVMFMTLTRTNYVLLICAILAYVLIVRGIRPWVVITLAFTLAFLVFGTSLTATEIGSAVVGQEGVTNLDSLSSRLHDWEAVLGEYLFGVDSSGGLWTPGGATGHGSTIIGALFGYGLTKSEVFAAPIDNFYLGIFMLSGVVGLFLWAIFFIWTFSVVIRRAQVSSSPAWLAMASYLVAFTVGAQFQNILNIHDFLILTFLLFGGVQWDTTVGYRRRGVSTGSSRGSEPNIPHPLRIWQGPGSQANSRRREVA
jgi:hypothetical protein